MHTTQAHPDMTSRKTISKNSYAKQTTKVLFSILQHNLSKFITQTGLYCNTTTTAVLRPFFWGHPGEPVPEENFWTLWCKGRLTEADTSTIQLGATPSRLTCAHLHRMILSEYPNMLWCAQMQDSGLSSCVQIFPVCPSLY